MFAYFYWVNFKTTPFFLLLWGWTSRFLPDPFPLCFPEGYGGGKSVCLVYRNFLCAISAFSHFSSASAWALPKGHSCCFGMNSPQAAGQVPALPWRPLSLVLWPLCSLAISHSTLCSLLLLAFPFVRRVFCESSSPWLQGSVMPQGWSTGLAGMGYVQHWGTSGLSPWMLPLQLFPCQYHGAICTQCGDLYYLDHFQFPLLFCF